MSGGAVALERCEGRWRPALEGLVLSRDGAGVPTVAESVAAFNLHVRPLERARRTRSKYATHRLSVLTWAVWKGVLKDLLPMSEDMLCAFIWHCVNAIKAWHRGDYLRLTHSLARFQGTPRRMIFPIHARAV